MSRRDMVILGNFMYVENVRPEAFAGTENLFKPALE